MFGKGTAQQSSQSKSVEPKGETYRSLHPQGGASKIQHSIIASDMTITGELRSAGDITVEGTVEGNIHCRSLTLSGEPRVKGVAHAESAIVSGTFNGDIKAKKVTLTRSAKVCGKIYNETLEIQPGADFEGEVARLAPEKPVAVASIGPKKANGAEPPAGDDTLPTA